MLSTMSLIDQNKPDILKGDDVGESGSNVSTAELDISGTSSSVLGELARNATPPEIALRAVQIASEAKKGAVFCVDTLKRNIKDLRRRDKGNKQYKAIMSIAKMLRADDKSSVDTAVKHGVLPVCVDILKNEPNSKLKSGAASALKNIIAGNKELIEVVVDAGVLNPLTDMLKSTDLTVAGAALQALAYIAEKEANRQSFEIYKSMVAVSVRTAKYSKSPYRVATRVYTLVGVYEVFKSLFLEEATKLCIHALTSLLALKDMEAVGHVCWGIHNLCRVSLGGLGLIVEQVIESGAVSRLVELLDCRNGRVITECIQAVRYIVGVNERQTQHFIDSGILPKLVNLMGSHDKDVVWHATCTVRNIAEFCTSQLSEIILAGIVPVLVQVLNTGKLDARKEAVHALKHIALETDDNISDLYDAKAIQAVCDMLRIKDPDANLATLDAILTILNTATKFNHFDNVALAFEECGGLELIEGLQNHENEEIYKKAFDIIDQFFSG